MARYTGPKVKISRRLGVNIFENEKGRKALEKRPYPPGEHGRSRRRQPSEYSMQLQEKQKAKHIYGVLERQFENLYKEATRQKGVTGENLLRMLEQRLDNIVFRAGWARTRPQARQFVNHGLINVNGRRVDIPSYQVRPEDIISIKAGTSAETTVRVATELISTVPPWLQADHDALTAKVLRLPERDEIDSPVEEQLIVELYSK